MIRYVSLSISKHSSWFWNVLRKNQYEVKSLWAMLFWNGIRFIENRILPVFRRGISGKVSVLTNLSQSAQTFSGLEPWIHSSFLSNSSIDVMESTQNWLVYNLTVGLNRAGDRWVFLKWHMRSADVVIIIDVFVQHAMQMLFVENDYMTQTLSA